MSGYVLDACALIALFNGEEGKAVLERVFISELPIRIAAVNVLEITYDAVRRQNDTQAAKKVLAGVIFKQFRRVRIAYHFSKFSDELSLQKVRDAYPTSEMKEPAEILR